MRLCCTPSVALSGARPVWKEEFDKLVVIVAATGIGGFLVGVFRIFILGKYGGLLKYLASLCGSMLAATLAGLAIYPMDIPLTQKMLAVGLVSFVADDVLLAIMAISSQLRQDPIGFFVRVTNAIRGRDIGRKVDPHD